MLCHWKHGKLSGNLWIQQSQVKKIIRNLTVKHYYLENKACRLFSTSLFKEKVLQERVWTCNLFCCVHGNLTRSSFLSSRTQWNRKRFLPIRNMLFVSINFSLEKDSMVFSAFVNYNILMLFLKTVYQYLFTFASIFVLHSNSNSFINKTIAALRLNYGLFTYNNYKNI